MKTRIKLALVDDDQMVVELLSNFFSANDSFEVCLTALGGNPFMEQLRQNTRELDIVLLDLRMEDGDGIKVIELLKEEFPTIKIVVLSSHARTTFIGYMLKLGINAFLPKQVDKNDLVKILKEVHEKGYYFSLEQVGVLRSQITTSSPRLSFDPVDQLTEREVEVLELLCQQFTAKQIAEKLFISVKAIESRKSSLMQKLGAKNMAGLIIAAVKYKLVDASQIELM